MEDTRGPEHKAIRAGIEALYKALPGRMSMFAPGEFKEEEYGPGETIYQTISTYKADSRRDGTDDEYRITVEVVKKVNSNDSYWREQISDRSNAVVINGVHYRIGPGNAGEFRGFGGRQYDIEFLDGRRVTTRNLWYQGPIPPKYLIQIPDNARWVHPEQEPFGGRHDR